MESNAQTFELVESCQKFEDLLATNSLFVDYFNEFLVSPSLGERVKFNFVSGDLEYIDTDDSPEKDNDIKELIRKGYDRPSPKQVTTTAEMVKKNLEFQLKSIIKKNPDGSETDREREILAQAGNHAFKDLDLIRIESRLEPTNLKDPVAASHSKIPIVKTRYSVNVLKKPFSMKWLRYRRLTLFLQSELYSEFKLAMVLAQCAMFNNEIKLKEQDVVKKLKLIKLEIDDELLEMELNPFNAKNDLEKLNEFKTIEDDIENAEASLHLMKSTEREMDKKSDEYEDEFFRTESTEDLTETSQSARIKDNSNCYLIDNDKEFYRSINEFTLKTSLIISQKNETKSNLANAPVVTGQGITVVNSVNEMANILVRSVLNQALSDYNESVKSEKSEKSAPNIEKQYRYSFSAKRDQIDISDYSKNKTSSRLNYYKDFNLADAEEAKDERNFTLEFEDEPYELTDSKHFQEIHLRKQELENFKSYLRENDAFIYFKIWIDIEKLSTLINEKEKTGYIKYLKSYYNKPNILNRLREDYDRKNAGSRKAKYYELYAQYENNLEYWSFDNLTQRVQKKVLKSLIEYWWPKYYIRMNSFKDYVQKKYPSYYTQKVLGKQNQVLSDLDAENIDKSLRIKFNLKSSLVKPNESQRFKKKNLSKVKILENNSFVLSKSSNQKFDQGSEAASFNMRPRSNAYLDELIGYDLDDFKTSPPVGWKRPISRATQIAKKMCENQKNAEAKSGKHRNKTDKEIYLEAIYRQDISGQIFMKYLLNKNKIFAVNRLKCLLELMHYKDLFYDDNFNQEDVKKKALDIYSKYVAVSANNSIDCPKADRLKIHHLFNENSVNTSLVSLKANSVFIPTYEDTFDAIEEFLLLSLYDDWKNEIENIERSINIKSRKIDELIEQGLLKISPKSINSNVISYGPKKTSVFQGLTDQDGNTTSRSQFFDLNELITNTRDFEMFKSFLESKNALTDILCWMDIEAYSRIDPNDHDLIEEQAKKLKKLYLNKKYLFSKNGPIDQETQNLILEKIGGWNVILQDIPPNLLIILARKHIENKLKSHWIPMYINSDYRSRSVFKNRTQMMDVVDDVLHLKNKHPTKKEFSKIKKNRWLYSSQMIINFGKALRNSFTVKVFSKFLTYKSIPSDATPFDLEMNNNLVNDLQFLVEVQEYKDMYQRNPENERPIIQKMKHVIDCFINNRIPPRTRIDIPEQLAESIIEQKDYLSPYLFLDAYLIVFNYLMPYWIEFNHIRSGKELELFDEFSSFKKLKEYGPSSARRVSSATSQEDSSNEDQNNKWRYNQYIKALKTQLIV
ncbi:regulator of G- signaling 22 [Brachionus plicatilis]|uniref:Regulator of G-signaling 22 n=1 Tax=Brachionus plicatilis TaxID=10195 RepID=A0A3M7RTU5_BRAPC|nr:regulator of G- signaling 22 [Brachionus plicatilis]